MKPDSNYDDVRQALLKQQLAERKAALSEEETQKIIDQAEALKQRQLAKDDESILPKVGIPDVPLDMHFPNAVEKDGGDVVTCYNQGTNGLVYQQIIVDLPNLEAAQRALLPIYTSILTGLGIGDHSYLDIQNKQSALTGGIGVYSSVKGSIEDVQNVTGNIVFSGKALVRNSESLADMLRDTLLNVRFDEYDRIKELVAQMRARREQSVTSNGHALAMGIASSGMSPTAKMSYDIGGVAGIKAIKSLDDRLNSGDVDVAIKELADELRAIHESVLQQYRKFLIVCESEHGDDICSYIEKVHADAPKASNTEFNLDSIRSTVAEGWITSTQVNFCAKAFPTVSIAHQDAPALTVLGGFLRNGYLHRAIREQGGAYGGGASQDSGSASFRFYSYRDPRLTDTLDDFDKSIEWLKSESHSEEELEQAILGVVSQIDKPRSPAGEAKGDYHSELFGRTKEHRKAFRAAILNVTLEDLLRVADTYLKPELASVGVIAPANQKAVLEERGLEIYEL